MAEHVIPIDPEVGKDLHERVLLAMPPREGYTALAVGIFVAWVPTHELTDPHHVDIYSAVSPPEHHDNMLRALRSIEESSE